MDDISIKKKYSLKDLVISYSKDSGKFYSSAEVVKNGFLTKQLEPIHYNTLDEAVQGIKDRIEKLY